MTTTLNNITNDLQKLTLKNSTQNTNSLNQLTNDLQTLTLKNTFIQGRRTKSYDDIRAMAPHIFIKKQKKPIKSNL
jgi:virulence-associated protein VapD